MRDGGEEARPYTSESRLSSLLLVDLLPRVLDHRHRLELDVRELAIHLFDWRMYSFCTMSRVSGSIMIGPRGLFVVLPALQQLHRLVGSNLPFCASIMEDRGHAVIGAYHKKLGSSLAPNSAF